MPTINEAAGDWIKDGTATSAPETVSTPAPETVVEDRPRDEHGRFVSTASAEPVDASTAASATPAAEATPVVEVVTPAVEAAAANAGQTVEEFLEGRLGDQPFQIPKGLLLPWKRGKENGFAPITEVLASDMMERDYRHKTQAAAEQRRQLEAAQARLAAREAAVKAEAEQLRAAMLDPEKLNAYNEHYEQMAKNPIYRKQVEDAQRGREDSAELAIVREQEQLAVQQEAATNLGNYIIDTAAQYPGVDPDRVRAIYSRGLISGDIQEITEASIHQVYKQEADYVTKTVSPLQAELTALKAQVAALSGAKAAEAHNANIDKKLVQAKAAPVVAAKGNGTAVGTSNPPTQLKPFTSDKMPDAIREWSRRT
jgi:hypothetical protein